VTRVHVHVSTHAHHPPDLVFLRSRE
jgi:hypothetical protein